MKKLLIISLLLGIGLFFYINSITAIYARQQAQVICLWINAKTDAKPAVGPSAYGHLVGLKEQSGGNCTCEVVEPNRFFSESNVKTVLISVEQEEKIRLNYTLSYGGRSFIQPIYFHHQTNFEHQHKHD
ncbi:MAG: hypothetical protein AB8E82_03935 [Aureispira sp.]